jgi:hypothetical protein
MLQSWFFWVYWCPYLRTFFWHKGGVVGFRMKMLIPKTHFLQILTTFMYYIYIEFHLKYNYKCPRPIIPRTLTSALSQVSGSLRILWSSSWQVYCQVKQPSTWSSSPFLEWLLGYQSDKNWFAQKRELCYQYGLPHPLLLLRQPPTQQSFKTLIKANWFLAAKAQETCWTSHLTQILSTPIHDIGPSSPNVDSCYWQLLCQQSCHSS